MKRERILFLMLIISVLINVVLAHKVRQYSSVGAAKAQLLPSGALVPPIDAIDLNGKKQTLVYSQVSNPTVLYIFTPPCSWCARNMENIKQLAAQKGTEYRFIGLSLSKQDLRNYVASQGLTIPVYTDLSAEILKTYKLGATPQTIVVSAQGQVLKDWIGAYVGDQKTQVEKFFQITLPGITAAPLPSKVKQDASGSL